MTTMELLELRTETANRLQQENFELQRKLEIAQSNLDIQSASASTWKTKYSLEVPPLEAQRDALAADLKELKEKLKDRILSLETALRQYGKHGKDCLYLPREIGGKMECSHCVCGLEAALAGIPAPPKDRRHGERRIKQTESSVGQRCQCDRRMEVPKCS
ncbi:MAG: hypothetical protein Q7J56_01770 [Deltaproteobacteria bacterium]|nr:hypothetical protein [Deltaproteobacteria bacterium]